MKITEALKNWAIDNLDVDVRSSDEQIQSAVSRAVMDGDLSAEKLADLTETKSAGTISAEKIGEAIAKAAVAAVAEASRSHKSGGSMKEKLGGGTSRSNPNVLAPSERYSDVKYAGKSAQTGLPVRDHNNREVLHNSERERALVGSWLKRRMIQAGLPGMMSEHEDQLYKELVNDHPWTGQAGEQFYDYVPRTMVKALLDGSTSGGENLNPNYWDNAILVAPLLRGQLYPLCDLQPMSHGSTADTASISRPTVTYGSAEGTAHSLFDTASMVAQITADVKPVVCALEFGREWASDLAVNIEAQLSQLVGEAYMASFDFMVASGLSASGQMTGIFNASGTTTVNSSLGITGPLTIGDAERLWFAVPKAIREEAGARLVFVSNDTGYARFRSIPRGSDDAERISGMSYADYSLLGTPYKIQNDIADGSFACAAMNYFRVWTRGGVDVRFETAGQTLALKNTALIVSRARLAGKPVLASAFAVMTDGATVDG